MQAAESSAAAVLDSCEYAIGGCCEMSSLTGHASDVCDMCGLQLPSRVDDDLRQKHMQVSAVLAVNIILLYIHCVRKKYIFSVPTRLVSRFTQKLP